MRKLVTRLQAHLDLEEAVSWYESRRPGLGLRLLDEFDYVMRRIAGAPLQFPAIHSQVRRALLRRFPYSVYFVADDEQIEVIAVLHQHRHPDTWRNRL
jgi:plasmid stabilization system protein ParE